MLRYTGGILLGFRPSTEILIASSADQESRGLRRRSAVEAPGTGLLSPSGVAKPWLNTSPVRRLENHAATVLYRTAYNPYFRTNLKVFRATDLGVETGSRGTDCPWHRPRGGGIRGKLGYTQAVACFMGPADRHSLRGGSPPYGHLRLICRRCGSPMRIMAVITEPQQVRKPRRGWSRPP